MTRMEAASRMSSVSFLKARPRTAIFRSLKLPRSFSVRDMTLDACSSLVSSVARSRSGRSRGFGCTV